MSEENVGLTYRAYDMFNRRDLDGFLTVMAKDVRADSRLAPIEESYIGHDGIRRWWKSLFDGIPDFRVEVIEVRDLSDDLTLSVLHNRGHGAASATPFDERTWTPVRWREGECIWWAIFLTEEEALEAAGLSE